MYTWWPWNSLRKAYLSWQAMESRRLAARKELERRYLDLRQVVESAHLEPNQGLLRAARLALDQPLDPLELKANDKLEKAFAILGKSFFRQMPAALQIEMRRYACHIEAVCRRYEEMGARLLSAQKVIGIFRHDPSFGAPQDFRLALISPEAAWLSFHLRQRRLAECQTKENCLARGWRTRMATCQRWLGLLHNSMPSSTFRQFDRNLKELAEEAAGTERQDVPTLLAHHAKLDLLIAVANRQATRTIAGLLHQKAE
jgi:hypothetical protein